MLFQQADISGVEHLVESMVVWGNAYVFERMGYAGGLNQAKCPRVVFTQARADDVHIHASAGGVCKVTQANCLVVAKTIAA